MHNIWLCESWADEYRTSAFVILFNFSNLDAVNKNYQAREQQDPDSYRD